MIITQNNEIIRDVRIGSKVVFNIIQGNKVLYYYIPETYIELEWARLKGDTTKIYASVTTDENNKITANKIPVRRLGDGCCMIFDTITQDVVDGPQVTSKYFQGGPIKMIPGYYYKVTHDTDPYVSLVKNSNFKRAKQSFLTTTLRMAVDANMQNITFNGSGYYFCEMNRSPYDVTNGLYKTRSFINKSNVSNQLIQHINPNWNVVYGSSITEDQFINNQNLYISNLTSIKVVPIKTIKTADTVEDVAVSDIKRIVHIPYHTFVRGTTGASGNYFNFGPIEQTTGDTYEVMVTADGLTHKYQHYEVIFGGRMDKWRSLNLFMCEESNWDGSEPAVSFNNGVQESEPYDSRNVYKKYLQNTEVLRCSPKECIYHTHRGNGIKLNDGSGYANYRNYTMPFFTIGCGQEVGTYSNNFATYFFSGKIHYLRIERQNELYRHYLPAILLKTDGTKLAGYFECREQIFYRGDGIITPAFSGSSLADDWSNVIDINGDFIDLSLD